MTQNSSTLSVKMIECLSHPLFPTVDSLLRAGKHLCEDDMDKYNFIHDYFHELDTFYSRYLVELIRAPENFFYLRTRSTSILASSHLNELEMLAGKVLCLLYLSPERLAQEGVFSVKDVYDELLSLIPIERLVKVINPRSTGSDLDKVKFNEKLRSALARLNRMGIITYLPQDKSRSRFKVRPSAFRFGNDVRNGEDALAAQQRLILGGEAENKDSLKEKELIKEINEITLEREEIFNSIIADIDPNADISEQEKDNQELNYSSPEEISSQEVKTAKEDEDNFEKENLDQESQLDDKSDNEEVLENNYSSYEDEEAAYLAQLEAEEAEEEEEDYNFDEEDLNEDEEDFDDEDEDEDEDEEFEILNLDDEEDDDLEIITFDDEDDEEEK